MGVSPEELSDEDVGALVRTMDKSGDGKIKLSEFVDFLKEVRSQAGLSVMFIEGWFWELLSILWCAGGCP